LAAIWLFLHQRAIGFCLLWFFTALLPTSSFFPLADLAVEHRVYVALAGVAGLVATAAFTIASGSPRRQGFTIFTLAILAGLLIQSSRMRNEDYRSQLTIYEQVLRLRPEHLRARVAFTEALIDSGDLARAEACVDLTLTQIDRTLKAPVGTFHPFRVRIADYYLATVNDQRGRVRFAQGAYAEAEQCFVDALALDPGNAIIFSNLAAARLLLNRPDDALAAAQQAIALRPSYARSYALAAQAHLALGVTHTAVEAMRRSMDAAIAPGPSATDLETLRDAWLSHPRPVTAPGP
jgi:tetratricopeptide (TPR) repeat protein